MSKPSREARYQQIERWLRQRVLRAAPGDPLPSESELASRFEVSRMTARQAVQNLAAEGLVQRRRGAGTFVAPRPMHRHEGSLMSFTEDMRRRGMTASSRLLSGGLRPATSADLEALKLPDGARVVEVSRVRLADGRPLAIEHAALPAECAAVLADDLERDSLHASLTRHGRVPAIARSWIRSRIATAAEARLLQLPSRAAVLVERRIIYDTRGDPLEHTETVYHGDRYAIDAVFSTEHAPTAAPSQAPAMPG